LWLRWEQNIEKRSERQAGPHFLCSTPAMDQSNLWLGQNRYRPYSACSCTSKCVCSRRDYRKLPSMARGRSCYSSNTPILRSESWFPVPGLDEEGVLALKLRLRVTVSSKMAYILVPELKTKASVFRVSPGADLLVRPPCSVVKSSVKVSSTRSLEQ
jgi:hypothetical protein